MKRLLFVGALGILFGTLAFFYIPTAPKTAATTDTPIIQATTTAPTLMDSRHIALGKFFEQRNCPLLPYVDDFIAAADKYNIDYRLLAAISLHESTCGKRYPVNTNNPFGWHPIRTAKGEISVLRFESIPAAIDFITGQLANGKPYANKTIEKKLSTYCPTPGYAAQTIGYMNLIEKIQ